MQCGVGDIATGYSVTYGLGDGKVESESDGCGDGNRIGGTSHEFSAAIKI